MRLALLLTFGGGVAQASVVPLLGVGGVTPDVPLLVALFVALRRGPETGCLAGFLAGLLQDAAGGGLLGVQAATKAVAGFLAGLGVGRLWLVNPAVQVPGLVLLTLAEGLGRYLLLQLVHFPAPLGALVLHVILPQALYNGFVGAACLVAASSAEALRRRGLGR